MGKPGWGKTWSWQSEYIGLSSDTRGSETSQYPVEEKETSIP